MIVLHTMLTRVEAPLANIVIAQYKYRSGRTLYLPPVRRHHSKVGRYASLERRIIQ
jgi:hypothetical protein